MTRLLHKYGQRPILCLATRKIFQSNSWVRRRCCGARLAQIVLSSSTCQVVLHLLPLILFCQRVDVSHSVLFVLVFSDVTARCVRLSNRHLLIISVFRYPWHISCTSLNSSSFPFFHSLSLGDSVFVRSHPCFSRQGSLNDRSDSLSAFVIMWLCRCSMRCKRCTPWAASSVSVSFNVRRQDVESSGFNLWRFVNHNPWQWGSAPSLSAVTFFVNFNSGATICHGVPHKPSQFCRFPSITQCLSCPTFASHNSVLGNAQNCSCSIMMTNEDSLSHAACKRTDTVFSNFTKPNFSLQIAPLAFSIFEQFSSFHSFFRLCRSSCCS